MGKSYCRPIDKVKDLKEYREMLANIINLAERETKIIKEGGKSAWNVGQLERIVIPEMTEIQRYLLGGKLFLKYGKQQRLLESAYMLTDSIESLSHTPLGAQICKLQDKIDSYSSTDLLLTQGTVLCVDDD